MRVLLSTYGSRGDVEPLVGLAVRLRALGAEARVCAPPDEEFAELLAGAGVELVPLGKPVRTFMHGATPPSAAELARLRIEMVAEQFDTVAAAAEGCDVLVAAGLAQVAARSVAERLGIRYVYASYHPVSLPSPHHPPAPREGWPPPPEGADNRTLWDLDARGITELFGDALNIRRASLGLPPVDNVRDHVFTGEPWLATDPVLGPWREPADLGVVRTGAWILPDGRPLPERLVAFLEAGAPPVYLGFGSMRAPEGLARVAVEAIRARGRRAVVSRGWADLAVLDDRDDCLVVGEVNQQALFGRVAAVVHHGGAGTTATAARAGAPQVVVPQMVDQPYWAARVTALGIGAAHDGPTPTAASLSAALGSALSAGTRGPGPAGGGPRPPDGAGGAAPRRRGTATGGGAGP
ncbi:glycosyltransferase, partial [Streptomyces sp. NPDC059096]|uniref:glycosyltransferase n=1 Tax=Streptomyces sp. NPDC059096 TaxID=3346727 RepID=UPI00368BAE82